MRLSSPRLKRFSTLTLAAWIALALLTLGATGCAELPAQKAENTNPSQDSSRYDYFGWW